MVVARAGMGGIDEASHRFLRIVFRAQQLAVMVTGVRVGLTGRRAKYKGEERRMAVLQGLIRLRQSGAVPFVHAVHLSCLPQAIRLCYYALRLFYRPGLACAQHTDHQQQ